MSQQTLLINERNAISQRLTNILYGNDRPREQFVQYRKLSMNTQSHTQLQEIQTLQQLEQNQFIGVIKTEINSNEINNEQAYQQHRKFLENYKKIRELQLKCQPTIEQKPTDPALYVSKRCASMMDQHSSQQNKEIISEKMVEIHQRVSNSLLQQTNNKEKQKFKLFTEAIQTKNDIQRIIKERRFIKSQQSKYCEYQQPPIMQGKGKIPAHFRIRTEGLYDQVQLNKKAKGFIEKIHNQQQNLMGMHLMRKKKEECKKIKQQRQEIRKITELTELKRQQRRLRAEQNLLISKEKVKITQLINCKNLQQINLTAQKTRVRQARRSFISTSSNQMIKHQILNRNKYLNVQVHVQNDKSPKMKQISSDRIECTKQAQFNIKQKIKIRKNKLIRPTEYQETADFTTEEDRSEIMVGYPNLNSNKSEKTQNDQEFMVTKYAIDPCKQSEFTESLKGRTQLNTYTQYNNNESNVKISRENQSKMNNKQKTTFLSGIQ